MSRYSKEELKRRVVLISLFILIFSSLLVARLFWIQLVHGGEYSKMAKEQRQRSFRVYPSRGIIYDRNLIPLTNSSREKTMFIFNPVVASNKDTIDYITNYTDVSREKITRMLKSSDKIIEIPVTKHNSEINNNINGIVIEDKTLRYNSEKLLTHVIGYINDKDRYGIERYDDTLKSFDPNVGMVSFTVDSKERVIPGITAKSASSHKSVKPNSIKLTIDYHIQKIVEKALDNRGYKGAVIVNEVETGDILAMASRPNFNPNEIAEFLEGKDGELTNKAIQNYYPPGSIFKIVVLLSALENNEVKVEEKFFCDGSAEVYGKSFSCHKEDGHGEITLKEAMADSCNSVFIELGKRLGGKSIMNTASRLGFGKVLGVGLSEEITSQLPRGDDLLGPVIGNISIGQSFDVTPIQVANMMTIIANDGVVKDLSIIKDSVVTEEGYTVTPYKKDKDEVIASKGDIKVVKDFLEEVVTRGTGKNINLDDMGGSAGKSGSAQAGLNNQYLHGWFSGYFPKKNPRYVITVIIEKGGYASTSAAPVFEEIAREIGNLGKINKN